MWKNHLRGSLGIARPGCQGGGGATRALGKGAWAGSAAGKIQKTPLNVNFS